MGLRMETDMHTNDGDPHTISIWEERVKAIYPNAYCRMHSRRTYFETRARGIYSDVTIKMFEILVDKTGNKGPMIIGSSTNDEYGAWSNAWSRVERITLEMLEH
jgi:hypothetical protein